MHVGCGYGAHRGLDTCARLERVNGGEEFGVVEAMPVEAQRCGQRRSIFLRCENR